MGFPIHFEGTIVYDQISASHVESFQRTFLQRARERFERAHAQVEIYPGGISFCLSASNLPLFRVYHVLLASSGKIVLQPEASMMTYQVSFLGNFIILSLLTWCLFGSFFIFVVNGPLLWRSLIVILVWLIMVIGNSLIGLQRFKLFIGAILSEMNVRQL